MSSLQKFHRRTNGGVPSPFTTLGSGNATVGFWLGTAGDGISKLIVAPKTTESTSLTWGSSGTTRGTINTTDGLANTNTLYAFGSAAHPAAYYCKTLTQGGYNTWYLPAIKDWIIIYPNKSATPFATSNALTNNVYTSSTERNGSYAWGSYMGTYYLERNAGKNTGSYKVRPVRNAS